MSNAVIGALRADLTLNTAQFTNGVQAAQSSLTDLRNSFLALSAAATGLAAALGALAIKGANRIDELAKSARRLDSSYTGFRSLEMAAGEAGVPVEALVGTVQKMNMLLAEGNPAAVAALGKIGLTLKDLDGLEADQKLAAIADGVSKTGLSAAQTTSVLADLGVKSREMVLALTDGGAAFRDARADVEDYGITVSKVQSDMIEQANDRIGRLSLVMEYLENQLALKVVPTLGNFALAITESLREGGLLRELIDGLVNNLGRLATYVGTAVVGFGTYYVAAFVAASAATWTLNGAMVFLKGAIMRTGIGLLIVGVGELVYQFARVTEATGSAGEAARLFGRVAAAVANAVVYAMGYAADRVLAGFVGAFQGTVAAFQNLPNILGAIGRMAAAKLIQALGNGLVNGLPKAVDGTIAWVNEKLGEIDPRLALSRLPKAMVSDAFEFDTTEYENEAAAALSDAGKDVAAAFGDGYGKTRIEFGKVFDVGDVSTEFAKITDALNSVEEAADEATPSVSTLKDEIFALDPTEGVGAGGAAGAGGAGPVAAKEAIKELGEEAKEAVNPMEFLRDSLADVFASVVTGAKSAREGIGELLKKMAQMIANKAFTSLFDSVIGNGGGFGNFLTFLGIGANANGTPNWRGGLSLVGERGPELVNLPRGSGVITAQKTGRLLEGAGGGGRMIVELSPDLIGRVLEEANQGAIQVTRAGLEQFSSDILPRRQTSIAQDPRRRG